MLGNQSKSLAIDENQCSVEINENFEDQYDAIHKFMKQFNFVFKYKKHSDYLEKGDISFSKTYNYLFEKQEPTI